MRDNTLKPKKNIKSKKSFYKDDNLTYYYSRKK